MSNLNQSKEDLDAVLHWRGKHKIAVRERDGLQLSLNTADQTIDDLSAAVSRRTHRVRELEALLAAADERADVLEGLVREAWEYDIGTPLKRKIMAALKPAEGGGDEN